MWGDLASFLASRRLPRFFTSGQESRTLPSLRFSLSPSSARVCLHELTHPVRVRRQLRAGGAMPPTLRTLHSPKKSYMQRFHRSSRFFSRNLSPTGTSFQL